jgi:hypothetical protein
MLCFTLLFYLKQFQIMRFFSNPRKPMILALARPDPKKNITTLVKAFGEHPGLRNLANLVCASSVYFSCCLNYFLLFFWPFSL